MYYRREEHAEQEGPEHAPLAEILYHRELARAITVVEQYTYLYALYRGIDGWPE